MKIKRIEAVHPHNPEKHFSWSASMLLWDELPRWLLHAIEMELPEYHITINE
jgi:hypothetical protein